MSWVDEDRRLVTAAAIELDDYLNSTQLNWPLSKSAGMLTPGNLLLSIKRGNANSTLLDDGKFRTAVSQIATITTKRRAAWEKRMTEDLPYRIRMWQHSIEEYMEEEFVDASFKAQIKNRVIVELLLDEIRILDPRVKSQIENCDEFLKKIVRTGSFLWDEKLREVFPKETFWYLYTQIGEG